MKTVVAETVMLGREAFETLGKVEVIPDRQIGSEHLTDADALIIRSKTKVTPELLEGASVRFVGTATAGFEHIDFQCLEKNHMGWCAAPGCNAESVADYITAALLSHTCTCAGIGRKTLGIIGIGQVGSRVAKRAEALGLRVLLNDPPRAAREFDASLLLENTKSTFDFVSGPTIGKNGSDFSNHWKKKTPDSGLARRSPENRHCRFQGLEKVLAESDIVTLHVPLVTEKPWPTLKMADCRFFEKMKRGSVFINAARGRVVDYDALLHAQENGIVSHAVLDVWDPEPNIRTDILEMANIGTAHIAGYSLEGKLNGTIQVYREACHFFELEPVWDPAPLLPAVEVPELQIDSREKSDHEVLAEVVGSVYDIMADDTALRSAPEKFDFLRTSYDVRREFFNTRVLLSEDRPELVQKLAALRFKI